MFFDQFDKDAMRVIMDAQVESRNLGGTEVETQHLLLAATIQKGPVQKALQRSGLEPDAIKMAINPNKAGGLPALDKLFAATSKDELLPFAKDTERAFRASLDRCQGRGELVSSQELILSVLQDAQGDSTATRLLALLKLEKQNVAEEVEKGEAMELVGAGGGGAKKNSTLAQCSVDLTAKAREGKLDPVIGRTDEVRRCLQVLVRRRKNNPVLLGDPGVGKTAIAEGLAQLIADGKVPTKLKDKRVLSLELGMLVADTKYRGEFEERLKNVIEEVTASNDTILFIDEIHTLVGAGAAEGAIDAANLMKPALARGELQCIGATTVTEYRRYVEKDAALERRFQPVEVPEPSISETVQVLEGLQSKYAEHHGVSYAPDALEAAAKLAERYINDRFLPDKAIDLIDEAAAIRSIDGFELETGETKQQGSWFKMASTLSEDTAPSASLDHLEAQAASTQPRAQPEPLGSLPWPREIASGWPKVEDFPLSTTRKTPEWFGKAREGVADRYDWRAPALHESEWAKQFGFSELKARFAMLNVSFVDQRADAHVGAAMSYHAEAGKAKAGRDCLHYCLPGPSDAWALALYNLLLNNPRYEQEQVVSDVT
jgi:ATP-dependent Clp protease ATP-binding subunit ClpA